MILALLLALQGPLAARADTVKTRSRRHPL